VDAEGGTAFITSIRMNDDVRERNPVIVLGRTECSHYSTLFGERGQPLEAVQENDESKRATSSFGDMLLLKQAIYTYAHTQAKPKGTHKLECLAMNTRKGWKS
jgi:hypothetical protein